jgi:hypothetical protein
MPHRAICRDSSITIFIGEVLDSSAQPEEQRLMARWPSTPREMVSRWRNPIDGRKDVHEVKRPLQGAGEISANTEMGTSHKVIALLAPGMVHQIPRFLSTHKQPWSRHGVETKHRLIRPRASFLTQLRVICICNAAEMRAGTYWKAKLPSSSYAAIHPRKLKT